MGFQRWLAGEIITPTKLNSMIPSYILQGSDKTITSSTTLSNTDITFTPDVSATYYYEMFVCYSAGGTTASNNGDFKWAWSAAQATFKRTCYGLTPTGNPLQVDTGAAAVLRRPAQATAFVVCGCDSAGNGNSGYLSAWDRGTFTTTSTSASVTLQVAQGTSSSTSSIFRGSNSSRFVYQRIA